MIKNIDLKLESYGTSKFLFHSVQPNTDLILEDIDYLQENELSGIMPCAVTQKDEEVYLRYDIITDLNLTKLFSRVTTKDLLVRSMTDLIDTLLPIQESKLNRELIVLNKDYIYYDTFSNQIAFLYVPLQNSSYEKASLKQFFLDLMNVSPYDIHDDLAFFIKLHNYLLTSSETIDLSELREFLTEMASPVNTPIHQEILQEPDGEDDKDEQYYSPGEFFSDVKTSVDNGVFTSEYNSKKVDRKKSKRLEIEEEVQYKKITRTDLDEPNELLKSGALGGTSINILPQGEPHVAASFEHDLDYEGTTVLGADSLIDDDEGTTALGLETYKKPTPFLLTVPGREKIELSKSVLKIGRDPNAVDYTTSNRAVGREHAHILSVDGEYFIVDQNSTNGSFLNGTKLTPKERYKIKHDDQITLANEDFAFKLY